VLPNGGAPDAVVPIVRADPDDAVLPTVGAGRFPVVPIVRAEPGAAVPVTGTPPNPVPDREGPDPVVPDVAAPPNPKLLIVVVEPAPAKPGVAARPEVLVPNRETARDAVVPVRAAPPNADFGITKEPDPRGSLCVRPDT
jgi:hypothetical protein